MKRPGLVIMSALSVLATCAALCFGGRFNGHGTHHSALRTTDAYNSPAAARWRQSQPSHWRACLMQQ